MSDFEKSDPLQFYQKRSTPEYYTSTSETTKNVLYHSHKNISISLDGKSYSKPAPLLLSSVSNVTTEKCEFSFVINPSKGPHQVHANLDRILSLQLFRTSIIEITPALFLVNNTNGLLIYQRQGS